MSDRNIINMCLILIYDLRYDGAMQMNRTCMLGDLKKNMYHDRERITVTVPYPFSNLKKLSGFSIQYLIEEGPWGTWNIVQLVFPISMDCNQKVQSR